MLLFPSFEDNPEGRFLTLRDSGGRCHGRVSRAYGKYGIAVIFVLTSVNPAMDDKETFLPCLDSDDVIDTLRALGKTVTPQCVRWLDALDPTAS